MIKDEDVVVKIARIEESIKTINLILSENKILIKELQEDNIKKHDEIRDCYYLSEMSRKRFEEQYEILEAKIDDILNKYSNITTTCKLLHSENDEEHKKFLNAFSSLETTQNKKLLYLSKLAILTLIAIIIGLIGDLSGITTLLKLWF